MATSLIAPLVTTGLSFGASKLFGGGKSSLSSFSPVNINAGGLTSSGGTVTASPERKGLISSLASTFAPQADILKGLRESVAPGFSALRESRLGEIESAGRRAIGNLRDNLARRRVLGSSFGQDALARADLEIGKVRGEAAAETFLQEMDATLQLTNAEFETRRGEFQTFLDELNLQANVATQLASGATSQLGANARLKAQLDAAAASGVGKFFGQTFQPAIDKFFSSGSSAPIFTGVGAQPY